MYFANQGGVIMDAGEGTYGQILDHFVDKSKVDEVMLRLKAIYITHHHADHCLGTIKLLNERDALN